jgi:hypothetical protein
MNGERDLILELKKSMQMLPTQKFVRGIGSKDINVFLHELTREYKSLGRVVNFVWKKIGTNRSETRKGFHGKSIEKIILTEGKYVLFGKAKWNNEDHKSFMKRLKKVEDEKTRFRIFGKRADGKKTADHAVGILVDSYGTFLYDNAMKNGRKTFSVETIADKMCDINNCYVFDLFEVV